MFQLLCPPEVVFHFLLVFFSSRLWCFVGLAIGNAILPGNLFLTRLAFLLALCTIHAFGMLCFCSISFMICPPFDFARPYRLPSSDQFTTTFGVQDLASSRRRAISMLFSWLPILHFLVGCSLCKSSCASLSSDAHCLFAGLCSRADLRKVSNVVQLILFAITDVILFSFIVF